MSRASLVRMYDVGPAHPGSVHFRVLIGHVILNTAASLVLVCTEAPTSGSK